MSTPVHDDAVRRRLARRRTASVLGLSAALLAASSPGLVLLDDAPLLTQVQLPWWSLALLFAVTELVVMNVQYRREATTVSLSELPLVLALFFADPWALVVGRLVGVLAVHVVHRRSSPVKAALNAALVVAESVAAVAVLRLLLTGGVPEGPQLWLAAYGAVAVEQVLAILVIARVIGFYEGAPSLRELVDDVRRQLALSAMVVVVALVAVAGLVQDLRNAALLIAAGTVVMLGYRSYTSLFDRHLSLERLYGFSRVVSSSPEVEVVLRSVLVEAQQMLRAEQVEVTVLDGPGGGSVRVTLEPDGSLSRSDVDPQLEERWLHDRLVEQGKAVLLPRGSSEPAIAHLLARRGWQEALLAPLRGTSVFGTIAVADRMGEVRAFDAQDLLLLETVANHAAVAVQNGHLIDELRHEALHDGLTGLPNRVMIRELLDGTLEGLALREGGCAGVLLLDLDGFKDVNDSLGHAQGDLLLQEVAARLVSAVGRAGTVGRLGGDEFAIVLPDTGDAEGALRVARRVAHAFDQPVELADQEVEIGCSVGLALAPEHGRETSVLLKHADLAMYDAKGATGGLRLFDPSMDAPSERRLTLVAELRTALSEQTLQVHVQPQADLVTRDVIGVEALLRWQHPTLGPIAPDEFIPLAERSGLIGPLTSLVLDQSLAACAAWREQGHDLAIAVNLSTRSLLDADLVEEVRRLLRRHDVPARNLTLEVTEGGVMADPARAVALLLELRELGVRLSVDDFGTGYSSLSYLKRLPVQEVKIDKSFVLELTADGDDAAIVRSIVDLGRHLGLEVVAEGVEDEATWEVLVGLGCTTAQGWHLARPMPPAELVGWLRARESARGTERLRVVG